MIPILERTSRETNPDGRFTSIRMHLRKQALKENKCIEFFHFLFVHVLQISFAFHPVLVFTRWVLPIFFKPVTLLSMDLGEEDDTGSPYTYFSLTLYTYKQTHVHNSSFCSLFADISHHLYRFVVVSRVISIAEHGQCSGWSVHVEIFRFYSIIRGKYLLIAFIDVYVTADLGHSHSIKYST